MTIRVEPVTETGRKRLVIETDDEGALELLRHLADTLLGTGNVFRPSEDFRVCYWRGKNYQFNKSQAAVIRALYRSYCHGESGLSVQCIFEEIGSARQEHRVDHLFRHNRQGRWVWHQAWVDGLIRSVGKGIYQLNLDKNTTNAT